jgi:hypothetical protein
MQHLGNRRFEPLMRIRDHQLDAAQPAPGQRTQKLDPEGLGLGGANRHAQHLTPAVAVDGDSDDDRDRNDTAGGADFHISRIQPEIGPIAFQRPLEEGGDLVVDLPMELRR